MARRKSLSKNRYQKVIQPDLVFNSRLVTMTINRMMEGGKKSIAEGIFYQAMDLIKAKTNENPAEIFEKGLSNILPQIELKTRRLGGANYSVPTETTAKRKMSLGIKWLITYARLRKEHSMAQKLAAEILDAANNTGGSVKKKDDTHKMAEANRAFSHYRW